MNTLRIFFHTLPEADHLGRGVSTTEYPPPLRITQKAMDIGFPDDISVPPLQFFGYQGKVERKVSPPNAMSWWSPSVIEDFHGQPPETLACN